MDIRLARQTAAKVTSAMQAWRVHGIEVHSSPETNELTILMDEKPLATYGIKVAPCDRASSLKDALTRKVELCCGDTVGTMEVSMLGATEAEVAALALSLQNDVLHAASVSVLQQMGLEDVKRARTGAEGVVLWEGEKRPFSLVITAKDPDAPRSYPPWKEVSIHLHLYVGADKLRVAPGDWDQLGEEHVGGMKSLALRVDGVLQSVRKQRDNAKMMTQHLDKLEIYLQDKVPGVQFAQRAETRQSNPMLMLDVGYKGTASIRAIADNLPYDISLLNCPVQDSVLIMERIGKVAGILSGLTPNRVTDLLATGLRNQEDPAAAPMETNLDLC